MGPCAESVGLTSGYAYGLAVIQLPVMFVLTLHYPACKIDLYSTAVRFAFDSKTNHTGVDLSNPTELHYMHSVHVSMLFLLCSALICVFSITSMHMTDKGVENNTAIGYENFTADNIELVTHPTISMWNHMFVAIVIIFHVIIVILTNSPTSIHFVLLVTLLCYVSLRTILQPRVQYSHEAGPGAASATAGMYLFAVALYSIAIGYIGTNIGYDPNSYKIQLLAAVCFVSFTMLVFGHIWDSCPNMQTIINCRQMYVLCVSAIILFCYATWYGCFRIHYF